MVYPNPKRQQVQRGASSGISVVDRRQRLGTKLRDLKPPTMPYLGWKIFACRLDENTNRETKRSLIDWIRKRFSEDDWLIEDDDGGLTISQVEHGFEIMVKIEANSLPIDYTVRLGERQQETETYVVAMESEGLTWRGKIELKHKKLMEQVLRRLPWKWQKVGCYVEQGPVLKLVTSSNIEPGFTPFQIDVTTWDKLPIPEEPPLRVKSVRPRVVKRDPQRSKQRGKVNALKELMSAVDKEKTTYAPKKARCGHPSMSNNPK